MYDNLLRIAMSGIGQPRTTRQIIQPIQTRLPGNGIDTAQQQIHVIRLPTPQALGQLASDETRNGARAQIRLVPHAVQGDVGLDVLCELDCVACFAGEGEEVVAVERAGFVVAGLEDCGAAHGGFGGRDENVVFACYAEEDFHCEGVGWLSG